MPSCTQFPTPDDSATPKPPRMTSVNMGISCHGVDLFVGIRARQKMMDFDTMAVSSVNRDDARHGPRFVWRSLADRG